MRRPLCAALTVWLAAVAVSAAPNAEASKNTLEVQVVLEDSVFLEGQSIYAILTAHNVGTDTLRGLPPLAPVYGFTKLELSRQASGERLPSIMPGEGRYTGKGRSLRPGELFCEAQDLTLYFGNVRAAESGVAGNFGYPDLPIGEYALRWSYLPVRSGYNAITGREIRFSVKPGPASLKVMLKGAMSRKLR